MLFLLLLLLPLRRKRLYNMRDTFRLEHDLRTITSRFCSELCTEVVDIDILQEIKVGNQLTIRTGRLTEGVLTLK